MNSAAPLGGGGRDKLEFDSIDWDNVFCWVVDDRVVRAGGVGIEVDWEELEEEG